MLLKMIFPITNLNNYHLETLRNMILVSMDRETQNIFMLFFIARRRYNRKMAANEDRRAFCVLDFHISQSVVTVQCNFRQTFGVQPPSIYKCMLTSKRGDASVNESQTGRPPVRQMWSV